MGIAYIVSQCVHSGMNTFLNTFILKEIIDTLTNGSDISRILWLLCIQLILNSVQIAIHIFLENIFYVRLVKVSDDIQRELMVKAQQMDLECCDIPEYYDDFVIAASQSEDMVCNAIKSIATIAASLISMVIAGTLIFAMNPVAVVFPVIGFIINIITRFSITNLEYNYEKEKAKIGRKADYSRRVFYQPEYAKEIKLTGIEEALLEQFNEAVEEEKAMAKKYGLKIAILSLVNWILVFTTCQYFAVPVYLAYLAIVKNSIQLGDVASLKNTANNIQNHLDGMNYALVAFQKVGQYAERFRRFMDYKVNIEGCKGTVPIPGNDCTLELKNVRTDFVEENDVPNIRAALEKADFSRKLEELPHGINTKLTWEFSDSGTILSGDESQKAAIARIFMRDMPIAILDEPSSALDPIAEYCLNNSMMHNAKHQAVILISHRLSTTKDADRIILLEKGCITESGTHSELIAMNGTYAQMWNVQAEKYCAGIYA